MNAQGSSTDLEARVQLDFVRYANCWEDPECLVAALEPAPGKSILSIASAGDNAFRLAAEGASVLAVDLNPAQIALCKLKQEAVRQLEYPDLLEFLGLFPGDRTAQFQRLRPTLDDTTRAYWDQHPDEIAAGIMHNGKFERYFTLFRKRFLPLIHSRSTIQALFENEGNFARNLFYNSRWNNWRWRGLFRVFFGRWMMGRLGRDPEFFTYVEGTVSDRILTRTQYALTQLEPARNPWLQYILLGTFTNSLPPWLQRNIYPRLQANIDRVVFKQMGLEEAAQAHPTTFDGYNLSDVFEYLSPAVGSQLYGALLASARPRARLAYWNMLVPRECPSEWRARIHSLYALAEAQFKADRAWFYSRFVVEEFQG